MIVTTHYMDEAERFDRLVFLSRGRVKALGHPGRGEAAVRRGHVARGHLRHAAGARSVNRARLGAMVHKEFVQMRRDPATLRIILVVPVMQLLLFGYAIRTDVRNLATIVFDQSRSQESREFVQRLTATGNFVMQRRGALVRRRDRGDRQRPRPRRGGDPARLRARPEARAVRGGAGARGRQRSHGVAERDRRRAAGGPGAQRGDRRAARGRDVPGAAAGRRARAAALQPGAQEQRVRRARHHRHDPEQHPDHAHGHVAGARARDRDARAADRHAARPHRDHDRQDRARTCSSATSR